MPKAAYQNDLVSKYILLKDIFILLYIMTDYYNTNHPSFRRFNILENLYKVMLSEIPPFDQTKVTFKRESGVWHNENTDIFETMRNKLSSNRDWIAGWDPHNIWFNFPLILKDKPVGCAEEICPNTIKLLQELDGINTAGFSVLLPHSRLPLHTDPTGPTHGTMAFNLLLSGENSSLIVDKSPPYKHETGKAVLFNSELYHYARNDSDSNRTILYMDVVARL